MRKFTKIFASLLTVCLLVGAVMVLVLAKAPASIEDFGKSDNYETAIAGKDYTANFGSGSGSAGTYSSLKVVHDEKTDNNYIRYAFVKAATSRYRRDYTYAPYGTPPATVLGDYSYFTLDFDVCADQYVYTLNGQTMMGDTIPEGAENVRLSYAEDSNFSLDNRIFDEANNAYFGGGYTVLNINFKFDAEADAWRIYLGSSKPTDYYLSNKIGSWNHFTYAVKVIEKDGVYGYSQARVYFNGELLATSNISASNQASSYRINPRAIDWYIGQSGSAASVLSTPYSMGIDNFAPSFYPLGYTSGSAYGIDDLYNDADQYKSISYCEDVVYSMDYAAAGSPYISIDTGCTKYYSPLAKDTVLQNIKNGTIIETGMDILDFTPPASVDRFEVYLIDNAKFSLSEEAMQNYKVEVSALGYRVSKLDDGIVVNWRNAKGGEIVKTEMLSAGAIPSFGADTIGVFDFANGNIEEYYVDGWYFDIDGDLSQTPDIDKAPEAIRALSLAEINVVKQYCNGILEIYPSETTLKGSSSLSYAIEYTDKDGNSFAMIDVDGGYTNFADISTIAKNINKAPNMSTVYLYADASVNGEKITVGEGKELSIDLNGHNLAFVGSAGFVLSNDSILNVYSSSENSLLSFDDTQAGFSTVGGSANFNNCVVNVGKFGEIDGDNLSVSAKNLFEIATSSARSNDEKSIDINIEVKDLSGSFILGASDINVVINNSNISGDVLFSTDDSVKVFTAVEANVSVSGSIISVDALVGNWCNGANLTVASSEIYAFAADSDAVEGKVVFGADNIFQYDVRFEGEFVSTVDGVAFAVADDISATLGEEVGIALISFDTSVANEDVVLVVWNDAFGVEFKSEYYHKTKASAKNPSMDEMTDLSRFPIVDDLGNGWYDIGYTNWKNTAEGSVENALVMGETNVFVPVAYGPIASLDFMVNAALRTTEVGLNLFVKIPEADSNIIVDIDAALYYYDGNGNEVKTSHIEEFIGVDGYYAFELPLAVSSFDPREAYIIFSVGGFDKDGDGVEDIIELKKSFSIDFMVYAETVSELYACGSDDSALIFDLVQYKYNAYLESVGSNASDKIVKRVGDLLTAHGESCTCKSDLSDLSFTDAEKDAVINEGDALSEVILATEVDFSNGKPAIYFYVDASLDVSSVSIKQKGLEYNKGGWDYINNKIVTELVCVGEADVNGTLCAVYEYKDILLCNVASIMNISVSVNSIDEAGESALEVLTGAWSLASYIESVDDSDLAKALYAVSVSALEYRLIRDGE